MFEGAVARVSHPLEAVPHVDVRPSPLIHLRARSAVDLVQGPATSTKGKRLFDQLEMCVKDQLVGL